MKYCKDNPKKKVKAIGVIPYKLVHANLAYQAFTGDKGAELLKELMDGCYFVNLKSKDIERFWKKEPWEECGNATGQ